MIRTIRLGLAAGLLALGLAAPWSGAVAQGRTLVLVVGYAAGGGTDIIAREFAPILSQELSQTVVVENRGGAAGHLGSVAVARARPDGLTALFAVSTNVVVNPHLQRGDKIDLADALTPITQVSSYQYVLVVDPDVKATTLQELIALGRAGKPGDLTFSSGGVGSNNHLAGILFAEAAGFSMEHVSYRGTAPALMDVVGHRVAMNFSSPPPAIPLVREGKLRALAVTGSRRLGQLPEVPTLGEAGLPGIVINGWHGLFVPKATPPDIVARLEAASVRAARSARFAGRLEADGLETAPERTRAAFADSVREENAYWARKVRELDLKAE